MDVAEDILPAKFRRKPLVDLAHEIRPVIFRPAVGNKYLHVRFFNQSLEIALGEAFPAPGLLYAYPGIPSSERSHKEFRSRFCIHNLTAWPTQSVRCHIPSSDLCK
jgi:hypothetical protein